MLNEKKPYTAPTLTVHGDVERLTLNGNVANTDVPRGVDGTAFSPA